MAGDGATTEAPGVHVTIRVNDLGFTYRRSGFQVDVEELWFRPATVTAIVGPNGAGKTTFLNLLAGLLSPHRGQVTMDGLPVAEALAAGWVGYCPDSFPPRSRLTLSKWLRVVTTSRRGRSPARGEIEEHAAWVGVAGLLDVPLDRLSRGQVKLVGLCLALAGDPPVVLLDEPGAYLDPLAVGRLRRLLHELRMRGATVVISSHQLDELERVSDGVVFFDHGRPVPPSVGSEDGVRLYELVTSAWPEEARQRWPDATVVTTGADRVVVRVACSEEEAARIVAFLVGRREQVFGSMPVRGELEKRFHAVVRAV